MARGASLFQYENTGAAAGSSDGGRGARRASADDDQVVHCFQLGAVPPGLVPLLRLYPGLRPGLYYDAPAGLSQSQ